jgi:hypothetical protein
MVETDDLNRTSEFFNGLGQYLNQADLTRVPRSSPAFADTCRVADTVRVARLRTTTPDDALPALLSSRPTRVAQRHAGAARGRERAGTAGDAILQPPKRPERKERSYSAVHLSFGPAG